MRSRSKAGFTLVEILLAAVITVVLVTILLRITTLASTTVNLSTQVLTAFSSARSAFDIMTRNLSQATLNTYLDYYDATGKRRSSTNLANYSFKPVSYGRASDLQFIVRANQVQPYYGQEVYFQAPRAYSTDANLQSVNGLLNVCGYYVQFGGNQNYEPTIISSMVAAGTTKEKYRYRLMQGMEPTENMSVFPATSISATGTTVDQSNLWLGNIKNPSNQTSAYVTPLADNVIALVIWPRMAISDDPLGFKLLGAGPPYPYTYDSQLNVAPSATTPFAQTLTADQLPPNLMVTMVVLDEASAARLAAASAVASNPPTAIENALRAMPSEFSDASQYPADLSSLATSLSSQHLNFQFFSTTVALRESKWTTPQN